MPLWRRVSPSPMFYISHHIAYKCSIRIDDVASCGFCRDDIQNWRCCALDKLRWYPYAIYEYTWSISIFEINRMADIECNRSVEWMCVQRGCSVLSQHRVAFASFMPAHSVNQFSEILFHSRATVRKPNEYVWVLQLFTLWRRCLNTELSSWWTPGVTEPKSRIWLIIIISFRYFEHLFKILRYHLNYKQCQKCNGENSTINILDMSYSMEMIRDHGRNI